MKTRDIIKYCFAGLIAILTIVAITGMTIARNERRARGEEEARRIRETFVRNGINREIPAKIDPDAIPTHGVPPQQSADPIPPEESASLEEPVPPPATPLFTEVAAGMICPCDDCDHSLDICGCGHAMEIREFVEEQSQSGSAAPEIRQALMARFGESRLAPKNALR